MQASELVKHLQALIEEHGDQPMFMLTGPSTIESVTWYDEQGDQNGPATEFCVSALPDDD